jgi:hypothetical protein
MIFRRFLVTFCCLAVSLTACSKHTSIGAAPASAQAGDDDDDDDKSGKTKLSGKQIMQKGGLCAEDRIVDAPEEGSNEWVIYRVYELALGPNTPEALDELHGLFPSKRKRELKELYWPRLRKNVHKFMNEPGKAAYTICRIAKTDKGTKYFIKTSDPKQHPPPITVGDVDGENKIIFLTPF